jgi:Peptidase family M28
MATHFLHREAGFDTNLSPDVNGHDEFASYWAQTMLRIMHGFGAQVRTDPFPTGWKNRDGVVPGVNVEVTVPGALSPEQVVVIGCHYDAMSNSTQSAYDDTSGCAIELGVAQALATFWRSQHAYPARTLRFVLFDGEEQNLLGSFHYVNSTSNGNLSDIVAMFNEEQNGLGYPARFLGQLNNPFMPLYINVTPSHSNDLYSDIDNLPAAQQAKITHFRALLLQAIPTVFQTFQALTYYGLTYHDGNGNDVPHAIFTKDQVSNVQVVDDTDGGSDEVGFAEAGIPCATLVTDASYYDNNPSPGHFQMTSRKILYS